MLQNPLSEDLKQWQTKRATASNQANKTRANKIPGNIIPGSTPDRQVRANNPVRASRVSVRLLAVSKNRAVREDSAPVKAVVRAAIRKTKRIASAKARSKPGFLL